MQNFLLLCLSLLWIIPTASQDLVTTVTCSLIFDEGIQRALCVDFLDTRTLYRTTKTTEMNALSQRINNLIISMDTNKDDPSWISRIEPVIMALTTQYNSLYSELQVYLGSDIFILRTALSERGDKLSPSVRNELDNQLKFFEEDLQNSWQNVGSDLDLLNNELTTAKNNLPADSTDTQENTANNDSDTTPEESETEAVPEVDNTYGVAEVVDVSEQLCADEAEGTARDTCIFRQAWVNLNSAYYCDGTDNELCQDAYDLYREWYTDEEWQAVFEEYSVSDDVYASIAVLACELNPVTDDEGNPVPLSNCAEVEYIAMTANREDSDNDTENDGDFLRPAPGIWCGDQSDECGDLSEIILDLDESGMTVMIIGFVPRTDENTYSITNVEVSEGLFWDLTIVVSSPTTIEITYYDYGENSTTVENLYYSGD